jgi:hypothetical protein
MACHFCCGGAGNGLESDGTKLAFWCSTDLSEHCSYLRRVTGAVYRPNACAMTCLTPAGEPIAPTAFVAVVAGQRIYSRPLTLLTCTSRPTKVTPSGRLRWVSVAVPGDRPQARLWNAPKPRYCYIVCRALGPTTPPGGLAVRHDLAVLVVVALTGVATYTSFANPPLASADLAMIYKTIASHNDGLPLTAGALVDPKSQATAGQTRVGHFRLFSFLLGLIGVEDTA